MILTVYSDIKDFEKTQPISHRRGDSGYPYALVSEGNITKEIKLHDINDLQKFLNTICETLKRLEGGQND